MVTPLFLCSYSSTAASASSFSSTTKSGIIEVELKSAKLKAAKKGTIYVCLMINRNQKVQTKLIDFSRILNPGWNQKFVFSVPRNFIFDKRSSISCIVYRVKKFFPHSHSVIGEAKTEMTQLFSFENFPEYVEDHHNDRPPQYDSDSGGGAAIEEEEAGEIEEIEETEEKIWELKASANIEVLKGSERVGDLSINITAWAGAEVPNWRDSNPRCFPTLKGTLEVKRTIQGKRLSFVGDANGANLAMEADEFMMFPKFEDGDQDYKKPQKIRSLNYSEKSSRRQMRSKFVNWNIKDLFSKKAST